MKSSLRKYWENLRSKSFYTSSLLSRLTTTEPGASKKSELPAPFITFFRRWLDFQFYVYHIALLEPHLVEEMQPIIFLPIDKGVNGIHANLF
jgi:hypothetical protein